MLYVNEAGLKGLPQAITKHKVPEGTPVKNGGDALWKLRRSVVSHLPRGTVTRIAQTRASIIAARAGNRMGTA